MEISGFVAPSAPAEPVCPHAACGATSVCHVIRWYNKLHFQKALRPEFAAHPLYCAAFRKEFELGIRLEHPGLPRYVHIDESGAAPVILMEYIDGIPLSEFVRENPRWFASVHNLRRFMSEIFDTVGYLHSHGIIHLDIKPDNILVTRVDHHPRLIDLGMAASDAFDSSAGFTPAFAAPEIMEGTEKPTPAADLYSLGKTLAFIRSHTSGFPDVAAFRKLERALLRSEATRRPESAAAAAGLITASRPSRSTFIIGVAVVVAAAVCGGIFFFRHPAHQSLPAGTPPARWAVPVREEAPADSRNEPADPVVPPVTRPVPAQMENRDFSTPGFEKLREQFLAYVRPHIKSHAEEFAAWLNAIVVRGREMTADEEKELEARIAAIQPLLEEVARREDVVPGLSYDQKLGIASLEYNQTVRCLTSGTL